MSSLHRMTTPSFGPGRKSERRRVAVDRAHVAEQFVLAELADLETQAEGDFRVDKLRRGHLGQRLFRDNLPAARTAAGRQHREELRQVFRRGIEVAGRNRAEVKQRGLAADKTAAPVGDPHGRRQKPLARDFLQQERGTGHSERTEHVLLLVLVIGHAGHGRKNLARKRRADVRVTGVAVRRADQGAVAHGGNRVGQARLRRVEVSAHRRLARYARAVTEKLPQSDGRGTVPIFVSAKLGLSPLTLANGTTSENWRP